MANDYEPEAVDPPTPPWEPAGGAGKGRRRITKPLGPPSRRLARKLNTPRRLLLALGASLALLALAAVGYWGVTGSGPFQTQTAPLTPPASLLELATEYPELGDILQDPKLDSAYKDFLVVYQSEGSDAALELAQQRGLLNANGDLRLTLELDTTATGELRRELEENGIQVTAVSGTLMDVAVPLGLMERLMAAGTADNLLATITNLEHVVRIRLPRLAYPSQVGQPTPAASPEAAGTPSAVPETPAVISVGPLEAPSKAFMAVLGVLLCVVAPLLLALGVYLLVSGLGFSRRKGGVPAPAGPTHPPAPAAGQVPPPGGVLGSTPPSANPPATAGRTTLPERLPPAPGRPGAAAPAVPETPPPAPPSSAPTQVGPPAAGLTAPEGPPGGAPPDEPDTVRETRVCPQCGHANRAVAQFCARCGGSLQAASVQAGAPPVEAAPPIEHPTYCWNCGQRLRPSSIFCPYCGDRI